MAQKKRSRKKTIAIWGCYMLLIAVVVLYGFYHKAQKIKKEENNQDKVSELSFLLNKDLEKNYPDAPRSVVDLYSRIIVAKYKSAGEEDYEKLLQQVRTLMDDELLSRNPYETHLENWMNDGRKYKKNKMTISTYILQDSYEVEKFYSEGREYARVGCIYYTKTKAGTERTTQYYTLRKDGFGRWKILYWSLSNGKEEDENE